MSKIDKKKQRLQEQISMLETELLTALTKKTSTSKEVNVPALTQRIQKLKIELSVLK